MYSYKEAINFSVRYDELRRSIGGILKEQGKKIPVVKSPIDKLILQLLRGKMSPDAYSQWKAEGIITFEGEKGVPVKLETWSRSFSVYDADRASQVVTVGKENEAQIWYFVASHIERSEVVNYFGGNRYGDARMLKIDDVERLTVALFGFNSVDGAEAG